MFNSKTPFADTDLSDRLTRFMPFVIIACALIFYIPAIKGGFIWDDHAHVLFDADLQSISGLWKIWFTKATQQYYPLVYSSFWIEWQLFGNNPLGYHIVNVLLHSANAIVLALILKRLGLRGAWAAAIIFALHPVNVESVAWISERKNVLSGLFFLASILVFLKSEDEESNIKFYILSFVLFILALFSKTVVSTLPVILIIIRWMRARPFDRSFIIRLVPFFLAGLAMGLVTVWWEATQVGASGVEWSLTITERLMLPARIVWFYLVKLFIPVNLTFIYPRWTPDPSELWQWIFIFKLAVAFVLLWALRLRITRAPVAALACFVVTLFPALGLIDVFPFRYSFVADHFQYLASIFIIALIVGVVDAVIINFARAVRPTAIFVTIVVALILGILTWRQGYVYKDPETLWRDVLKKNPTAWIAHNNLGQILYERGEIFKATEHYRSAVTLWPNAGEARHNLASSLFKRGKIIEAETHFRAALKLTPNASHTLSELAVLLSATGRLAPAQKNAFRAAEINPQNADIQNNLGIVLLRSNMADKAFESFTKAVTIRPAFTEAHNNIGIAHSMQGQLAGAVLAFKKALSIDPSYSEGHYNLAVTLEDLKKTKEAEAHYREAVKLNPMHAQALNNLGNIYFKKGDLKVAEGFYRAALKADPNFNEAKQNLVNTLKRIQ
ncbi:MAG: tetratricopeptide repeat protein [Thermodesulfobacteriota bacterium]